MNSITTKVDTELISSRQVAETTGKEHKNVMRDIKALIDKKAIDLITNYSSNLSSTQEEPTCIENEYKASNGKNNPEYLLNDYAANVLATSYDPVIARKLLKLIKELHSKLSTPLTPAEALLKQVQLMVDVERRQKETEAKVNNIENTLNGILELQASNRAELKALPISTVALPEIGVRDRTRLLVNRYAQACMLAQQSVWDRIYQTLYYNYHVSIKSYAKKNKSESWLDVAERNGHIEKIYIIISNMLKTKGLSNI